MPSSETGAALALLVLLLAVAVPAAITVTNEPASMTVDLDEGEQKVVTQSLEVFIEETTSNTATVTLRDREAVDSETQTLNENETREYTVRNETMNVTLREVQGPNANATVAVEYPRTYGWNEGAKTIVDNLPLVIVLVAFIVVMGGLGAATKR